MTGSILELAAIACDDDLNEVSAMETLVQRVDSEILSPFVHAMHTDSGLLEEIAEAARQGRLPRRYEAEAAVITWLDSILPPDLGNKKPPLAGSSVHFDRAWMKVHMPRLEARFSYRNIDASGFYEGALRWAPELTREGMDPKQPAAKHRAMADIRFSLERLRLYRKELFLGWRQARQELAEDSIAHAGTGR